MTEAKPRSNLGRHLFGLAAVAFGFITLAWHKHSDWHLPLPHALDQDQLANANVLAKAGGAIVLKQDEFTPARLAREVAALADADADKLSAMATGAKSAGALDAAEQLADLVLRVAGVVPR